ncbi:unnamed protein product [Ceutorhynchus assimilis]|uniref:Uncharacterized protein n=1 Tax=Ceutorhynchus assimilis TaxID=467358 RepID=A0A9N9MIW8_9CUCU|nr:unnamed protein product [Ceutorhynchus assimilis]
MSAEQDPDALASMLRKTTLKSSSSPPVHQPPFSYFSENLVGQETPKTPPPIRHTPIFDPETTLMLSLSPPGQKPQCSRFSRRYVPPDGSQTIFDAKGRAPRPILGNKQEPEPLEDEASRWKVLGPEWKVVGFGREIRKQNTCLPNNEEASKK